jgi:hypothetical protein
VGATGWRGVSRSRPKSASALARTLDLAYGMGRLAFGAGLLANPARLGNVLIGKQSRKPSVRTMFRFYGTRDTVLGLGALRAAARGGDVAPWLAAGVLSDALDAGVLLAEWDTLPPGKRVPGVLAALGAGVAGIALLATARG